MTQFKGVYISKPTELTFRVEYQNLGRTTKATVYQQIGDVKNKVLLLFGANATYKLEQKYKFEKPENYLWLLILDVEGGFQMLTLKKY
jgi:hypothetical protein